MYRQHAPFSGSLQTLLLTLNCPCQSLLLWTCAKREFLLAGEACFRREKSQAIAGPGHSIAVTSKGTVYSFGSNSSGQLGHGTTEEEWRPRQIRSLQGIRIVQAAAGAGRTMLISDAGKVYAFGKDSFGETEYGVQGSKLVTTPHRVVKRGQGIYIFLGQR
ncbi:unnamed protein product [Prunus armeniaca]|uniref:Uncharacterized protein n=1 Tax=Prunus armeniaca TaxID=36596 RepID=A0A6J5VZW9_PRUAR|nr:unnamed protein product [Prunus armeniaca]